MSRLGIVLAAAFWVAAISAAFCGPVSEQNVKHELRDILSQPEYNSVYEKTTSDGVWEYIADKVGRFFAWIGRVLRPPDSVTAGRIMSFVLAWIVIVAFVILVALVIRRFTEAGGRPELLPDDGEYELPSAGPLMKQAGELARARDYRGAFRCAYIASISYLDEIKALRFERSRTNWEYLRELRDGGREQEFTELRPLTLDFDRKFYGSEPCDQSDYEKAVAVYQRIVQAGVA